MECMDSDITLDNTVVCSCTNASYVYMNGSCQCK